MAEKSFPFDSVNGDRLYSAEDHAWYLRRVLSNGVIHTNNHPTLRVKRGSGLQSLLEVGGAIIDGYAYENTNEFSLTHEPANTSNPRIDRVVLRLDKTVDARHIKAFIKPGTPATNSVPPELTRNQYIYELSLAQVRINPGSTSIVEVIDERLNKSVCGIVSSLISIPTEQFLEEWHNWVSAMNDRKAAYQLSWEEWFASRQNEIGVKVVTGLNDPIGVAAGDVWLKPI